MIKYSSLSEAVNALEKRALENSNVASNAWSPLKVLHHCAQSIEYSVTGYPILKPAFIRKTIGKFVARKFIKQGHMSHGLTAPIAGAPALPETGDVKEAVKRLKSAVNLFENHKGSLAPHLVYGDVSHDDYAKLHTMHIANHMQAL